MLVDDLQKLPNRQELGEKWFDLLDDLIKHDEYSTRKLIKQAKYPIIASGGYCDFLKQLNIDVKLSVPGHIRKSRQINLDKYSDLINGNTFTFVDDSYYKGRTLRKVLKEIFRLNGKIGQVLVVYNDSKDCFVDGLINYTDLRK